MSRFLQLALRDLKDARDSLYRARSATQHVDPAKEWGQSGQTLNEIIAGYEEWEREAMSEVALAEKLKV